MSNDNNDHSSLKLIIAPSGTINRVENGSAGTADQHVGQHLSRLFKISQNYGQKECEAWFRVITSRGDTPTALTQIGDENPAHLTLTLLLQTHPDFPGFRATITPIGEQSASNLAQPLSLAQFSQVIESSDVAIYTRGLDGCINQIIGSETVRPSLPTPLQSGQSVFDLYPPETLRNLLDNDARVVASGKPSAQEDVIPEAGGHRIFHSTKFPLYDADGALTGISGLTHEITEYSAGLHQLRLNQERVTRSLMESSFAVLVADLMTGEILAINRSFTARYGYTEEESLSRHPVAVGICGQPAYDQIVGQLNATGEITRGKFHFVCKNGNSLPVEMNAFVIKNGHNPLAVTLSQDQSRAEAAESRLQLIADAAFEGIVLHDHEKFLEVNQQACVIFGRSREEIIGASFWDLLPQQSLAAVRQVLDHPQPQSYEIHIVRPDGKERQLRIRSQDVSEGSQAYRIGVFQDITEEENLKVQLRRAQKMEVLGQLTGGIAHDFNNILASILGYSDLLKEALDDKEDERFRHWAEQIHSSGIRGRNLIRQMLSFSRGGGALPIPTSLSGAVEEVLQMLKVSLSENIVVGTELKPVPRVLIDPNQLQQILLNLCINAGHAIGEDHGAITISVDTQQVEQRHCASCHKEADGEYVAIRVSDTGHGIDPAIVNEIFEPFFSTKQMTDGSGMGLAVIHGIIHDCTGHILLDSTPGAGTSFTVLLPPEPPASSTPPESHRTDQSPLIVVVDDDQLISDMLYRVLVSHGYRTECYLDPEQALRAFTESGEQWSLLLTDQNMPGISGVELSKKVSAARPSLPIIIHTGYSATMDTEDARERGWILVEKPAEQRTLLDAIEKGLSAQL
ncbi:MAG TPA: hypothetical protein DCF45_00075 [Gammaproteobacteria bacterium]|nr:hypothetical protein [Gammaproteobacteria bacterium]